MYYIQNSNLFIYKETRVSLHFTSTYYLTI